MPSGHLPPTAFVLFLQNHDQIGNRAFGERLTALAEPAALEAAIALLLLCPQIPLLFMGEETASTTPFLFFTDHHDDLPTRCAKAGAREFAKFRRVRRSGTARANSRSERARRPSHASVPHAGPAHGAAREATVSAADRSARERDRAASGRRTRSTAEAIGPKAVVARWRHGRRRDPDAGDQSRRRAVPLDPPAGEAAVRQREVPAESADCRAHCTCAYPGEHRRPMTDEAIRDLATPRRHRRRVARLRGQAAAWSRPRCCAASWRRSDLPQHARAISSAAASCCSADHRAGRCRR